MTRVECVHRWDLGSWPPPRPVKRVRGTCKNCHTTRLFPATWQRTEGLQIIDPLRSLAGVSCITGSIC